MVRFLARTAITLLGNAVGLIVAAVVLDGMTLDVSGFILGVIIFTVVVALMQPFFVVQLRRRASSALGGVALIATFVSLVVTVALSDGISIDGIGTWVAATVIVWVASLLAVFILPYLGFRKYLRER